MRRSTWAVFTLAILAGVGAAACGSSDSGPSFNGTISDSAAGDFALSADDYVSTMMATYHDGGPNIEIPLSPATPTGGVALLNRAYAIAGIHRQFTIKGRPAGSAPLMRLDGADCTPKASGDTTDADDDGFPGNATYKVDCTTVDSVSNDTSETHITVNIADVSGIWGFNVSVNAALDARGPDGKEHISLVESEFFKVTTTRDDDNVNVDISLTGTPTGSPTTGTGVHYNWNSNFTPAEGEVLGAEAPPDGQLQFTGGFYVTDLADPRLNFSFGISTTDPLSYDSACGDWPPFTAGTVTGHLNGAAADVGFTLGYAGCGVAPTVDAHGNASS